MQIDVVLVGNVERKFQFGDLNLELLLYTLYLGLQLRFRFDDAGIQLLDLNAGLLARLTLQIMIIYICIYISNNIDFGRGVWRKARSKEADNIED